MAEQLNRQILKEPEDLMSLKELCLKHRYSYDYLYRLVLVKRKVTVYDRGVWKVSESELLKYSRDLKEKKLNKIKTKNGNN